MNLAMLCWLTCFLVRCVNKKATTDIPSTQGIVRVRFQMACSAVRRSQDRRRSMQVRSAATGQSE